MNSPGDIFGALFTGLIFGVNVCLPFILAFAAMAPATLTALICMRKYKVKKRA